jgi:hypothetical protein
MPDVRRKHPRPSEQISGANRFYQERLAKAAPGFEHYLAGLDQVTSIRELAFAQDRFPRFKTSRDRAVREQRELRAMHPSQKRMERHARGQWFGFYCSVYPWLCLHDLLSAR